jgi:hypothetical protein
MDVLKSKRGFLKQQGPLTSVSEVFQVLKTITAKLFLVGFKGKIPDRTDGCPYVRRKLEWG